MSREPINETVKRKLYAQSMGRCIKESLEQELHIPIDLTVLSQVELKDTHFLKKFGLFKVLK